MATTSNKLDFYLYQLDAINNTIMRIQQRGDHPTVGVLTRKQEILFDVWTTCERLGQRDMAANAKELLDNLRDVMIETFVNPTGSTNADSNRVPIAATASSSAARATATNGNSNGEIAVARSMNTTPRTLGEVNDALVRQKYNELNNIFDEAETMTTPKDITWPRIASFVVTISQCLPNEGGGNTGSTNPNDMPRREELQVAVRGSKGIFFSDNTAQYAFRAIARRLSRRSSSAYDDLEREDSITLSNCSAKPKVSFSFDKESHLNNLFGSHGVAGNSTSSRDSAASRQLTFHDSSQQRREQFTTSTNAQRDNANDDDGVAGNPTSGRNSTGSQQLTFHDSSQQRRVRFTTCTNARQDNANDDDDDDNRRGSNDLGAALKRRRLAPSTIGATVGSNNGAQTDDRRNVSSDSNVSSRGVIGTSSVSPSLPNRDVAATAAVAVPGAQARVSSRPENQIQTSSSGRSLAGSQNRLALNEGILDTRYSRVAGRSSQHVLSTPTQQSNQVALDEGILDIRDSRVAGRSSQDVLSTPTQQSNQDHVAGSLGATRWCPDGRDCPNRATCPFNHP